MTENIPQTSASQRAEQARAVINAAIASAESDDAGIEDLIEHRDALIAAIEELITPPTIGLPELVADFTKRLTEQGTIAVLGQYAVLESGHYHSEKIEAYRLGLCDGEQYAHERWEPADVPSQEFMLRHLGIIVQEEDDRGFIIIPEQHITKEVN